MFLKVENGPYSFVEETNARQEEKLIIYGRGYASNSATPSRTQKAWDPECRRDTDKEPNHFIHALQEDVKAGQLGADGKLGSQGLRLSNGINFVDVAGPLT